MKYSLNNYDQNFNTQMRFWIHVLRISLDSNIRSVGFRRFYFAKTNQSPWLFFRRFYRFSSVFKRKNRRFLPSKNLTKIAVPVRVRTVDPYVAIQLFHCTNSHWVVPTPLVGGGTIYSNGFFCSVNFGRSIYSSQRNVSGIIKKLIQRRIQN